MYLSGPGITITSPLTSFFQSEKGQGQYKEKFKRKGVFVHVLFDAGISSSGPFNPYVQTVATPACLCRFALPSHCLPTSMLLRISTPLTKGIRTPLQGGNPGSLIRCQFQSANSTINNQLKGQGKLSPVPPKDYKGNYPTWYDPAQKCEFQARGSKTVSS